MQLWREITAQGFKGGYSSLYRFVEVLRTPNAPAKEWAERAQCIPEVPLQHLNAKEAVWWFVRPPVDLEEDQQRQLALLRQMSPTAEGTYELVQEFVQMVRKREGHRPHKSRFFTDLCKKWLNLIEWGHEEARNKG